MESLWLSFLTARAGLVIVVIWLIYRVFHRLYLHPLAKFPGPKLAIISSLYEFYYDIVRDGQYTFKIQDLHREYGT